MKRIAVIGAGWAGLTAALRLQAAGHAVTVYERAPTHGKDFQGAGGRASTAYAAGEKAPFTLDNGQHVLLGAYSETFKLLHTLGADKDAAFLRLPAAWHVAGGLQMTLPAWGDSVDPNGFWAASPLKQLPLAVALLRAAPLRLWPALLLAALRIQLCKPLPAETVSAWLGRLRFPVLFNTQLWSPLCFATLNTSPQKASATVFARVIRDGLLAGSFNAAMLVPRIDLGAVLPAKALQQLEKGGATLCMGQGVTQIESTAAGIKIHSKNNVATFDNVVCATTAKDAARILPADLISPALHSVAKQAPEPICTIHLNVGASSTVSSNHAAAILPQAVTILPEPDAIENPICNAVVIDRAYLDRTQAGWLTVVLSCSQAALKYSHPDLISHALERLRTCFPALPLPADCEGVVIHAKQATFACEAGLMRPSAQTADPRIVLAGDYVAGPYPATIEGAVRSGIAAAAGLQRSLYMKRPG